MDRTRPLLVLTREIARPHLTMRDGGNTLDEDARAFHGGQVEALGPQIGALFPAQEAGLTDAVRAAFDPD